jgi:uncharacterized protein
MPEMDKRKSRSIRSPFWLTAGAVAGAIAAGRWCLRQRAARRSPLLTRSEVASDRRLTALITGASSGIGLAFAKKLAQRGYNLILVARRRERLEALATKLTRAYGVEAMVVTADLTTDEGITRVLQTIAAAPNLNLLVNNAGFGLSGTFVDSDIDRHLEMIRLHIHAVILLTRAALPAMLAQGRGAVINVSSLMSFYPIYGSTSYAGTKCYLQAFTEVLHQELMGTGVRAQCLCPGFVATELQGTADIEQLALPDFVWMQADTVVERSLRDLDHDQVISVPGLGYRLLATLRRLIPRSLIYVVGGWLGRSRLHNKSRA